ncbi:MAG: dihydroneopterin aldolase [Pseudomonadota bacterium]
MSDGEFDEVLVEGLTLPFFIGVHEMEKFRPQNVTISVRMFVHRRVRLAGEYASYADVTDYAIARSQAGEHIRLVEELATELAAKALENERVARVEVTLLKNDIYPQAAGVGIRISETRESLAEAGRAVG